jgi:hypothetical protein
MSFIRYRPFDSGNGLGLINSNISRTTGTEGINDYSSFSKEFSGYNTLS